MENVIEIPYKPRPLQAEIHADMKRFNVLVLHRRFGKSVLAINHLIKQATVCLANNLERPRLHYVAPLYRQAKSVAWDYLKHYLSPVPGVKFNESELRADFFGCRISLLGADNPDSARGIYSDYAVLDEYAQMNPRMWTEVLRPALSDRKGGALFIGTPQGKNTFHDLWQRAENQDGWYRKMFKASETGIIDPDELSAARREMSEDEYLQEFECSWSAAIKGAYYAKEISKLEELGRIGNVPYDPALQVCTSWDLGVKDSVVIWFAQTNGAETRIIDCEVGSGVGLDHYVKILKEKDYNYGKHFFPHDLKVRELSTGISREEAIRSMGITPTVVPKASLADGIQTTRSLLPRCWFDKEHCEAGTEALKQYRTEYDAKKNVFKLNPLHDWTSDFADSFRYLAQGLKSFGGSNDYVPFVRDNVDRWAL